MDNENDLVRDIKRERNQSIQFKRGRDVNQEGDGETEGWKQREGKKARENENNPTSQTFSLILSYRTCVMCKQYNRITLDFTKKKFYKNVD